MIRLLISLALTAAFLSPMYYIAKTSVDRDIQQALLDIKRGASNGS